MTKKKASWKTEVDCRSPIKVITDGIEEGPSKIKIAQSLISKQKGNPMIDAQAALKIIVAQWGFNLSEEVKLVRAEQEENCFIIEIRSS